MLHDQQISTKKIAVYRKVLLMYAMIIGIKVKISVRQFGYYRHAIPAQRGSFQVKCRIFRLIAVGPGCCVQD
jgi:hypothetical protein